MYLYSITFYIFSLVAVLSALMVISARNPVHSVLFLILSFVNASGLFVLLGAEFLAMILVVVYVGAVAVLFLFVVMMLDINFVKLREGFLKYLPIASIIGVILLSELTIIFLSKKMTTSSLVEYSSSPNFSSIGNTKELGLINNKTGQLQTHTLRYWETQFKQIKPKIRAGKRRYYSKKDFVRNSMPNSAIKPIPNNAPKGKY